MLSPFKLICKSKCYMKKLLLLFSIFVCFKGSAQPTIKIFAYSQESTPGIVPKVTDENGNPIKKNKEAQVNYYIFAVFSNSAKISFSEVWIKGRFYSVTASNV